MGNQAAAINCGFGVAVTGIDMDRLHELFERVVFSKLVEWSYEDEWRLMLNRPTDRKVSLTSMVESVTFGLKCSLDDMDNVLNLLKVHFLTGVIKFYRVVVSDEGVLTRYIIEVPDQS